jgi:hypothetical protein
MLVSFPVWTCARASCGKRVAQSLMTIKTRCGAMRQWKCGVPSMVRRDGADARHAFRPQDASGRAGGAHYPDVARVARTTLM